MRLFAGAACQRRSADICLSVFDDNSISVSLYHCSDHFRVDNRLVDIIFFAWCIIRNAFHPVQKRIGILGRNLLLWDISPVPLADPVPKPGIVASDDPLSTVHLKGSRILCQPSGLRNSDFSAFKFKQRDTAFINIFRFP